MFIKGEHYRKKDYCSHEDNKDNNDDDMDIESEDFKNYFNTRKQKYLQITQFEAFIHPDNHFLFPPL